MTFTPEQIAQLNTPLSSTLIKQRQGGGGTRLSYIKGKTAIDIANQIFGFGRWGYEVTSRDFVQSKAEDGTIMAEFYTADIVLQLADSPFTFPGDGVGVVAAKGPRAEAHEKARKEAVTDALKRALRHFGPQFGNDLYDEDAFVRDEAGEPMQVKNIGRTPVPRPASSTTPQPSQVRSAATQPASMPVANSNPGTITERQLESIRKISEALGKPQPAGLAAMSEQAARKLIQELTAEYRQRASVRAS